MGHGTDKSRPTGNLEPHLRIAAVLQKGQLPGCQTTVLIDTGAEACLIRKGLLPASAFRNAVTPLRLVAANQGRLPGGNLQVEVDIHFNATDVDSKIKKVVRVPTTLYEAEIEEDVILSYQWMGERDVIINPRQHGVWLTVGKTRLWVAGVRANPRQRSNARLPRGPVFVYTIPGPTGELEKPKALDLFCGRKSAAKVLERWGYEVTTVDTDPTRDPTICEDVLTWDYKAQFQPGHFQVVVASPPCTEYSAAKTKGTRDLDGADAIVQRTLEIIQYLQPERWWMENPRNGHLPKRKVVEGLPYLDIDYCRFEQCGYQKPTRFFGSEHLTKLDAVLCDQNTCPSLMWEREVTPGKMRRHRHRKGGGCGHVIRKEA